MDRLKTFGKYALMIIAFYVFSSIAAVLFIQTSYENMTTNIENNDTITIKVDEAKSTFVNGHVTGEISNVTNSDIQGKYIRIDFVSKRGNKILSKYLQVDELKVNETCNFTVNFEAENIKQANFVVVDEYVQENENTFLINLDDAESEEVKGLSALLAIGILLKFAAF